MKSSSIVPFVHCLDSLYIDQSRFNTLASRTCRLQLFSSFQWEDRASTSENSSENMHYSTRYVDQRYSYLLRPTLIFNREAQVRKEGVRHQRMSPARNLDIYHQTWISSRPRITPPRTRRRTSRTSERGKKSPKLGTGYLSEHLLPKQRISQHLPYKRSRFPARNRYLGRSRRLTTFYRNRMLPCERTCVKTASTSSGVFKAPSPEPCSMTTTETSW